MINYILLIASVAAGSIIADLLHTHKGKPVKILLAFSGAYLLSIGVFHIIPEIYEEHDHSIGLFIIGGFFLQIILEFFSKGMEHGHGHSELFRNQGIPVSLITSLYIHALLESMPIAAHHDETGKNAFLWAIVIHKIPVSIILYAMVAQVFNARWKIALFMLGFALIAPLGVILGEVIPFSPESGKRITAIVLGIFLHISTTILFETNESHKFNFAKFFTTLLAIIVAWFSVSH